MQGVSDSGSPYTDHDIMFQIQAGMTVQPETKMGTLVDGKRDQDHFDSQRIGGKFPPGHRFPVGLGRSPVRPEALDSN